MCNKCNDPKHHHASSLIVSGRRNILLAGAGLAATPFIGSRSATNAQAQTIVNSDNTAKEYNLSSRAERAWAAHSANSGFNPMNIQRRNVGPHDVHIQILYCGICHSDIHMVNSDWGPSTYPIVPGHEIIGRVTAVGNNVTKFRVGDIAGVGCLVDSCGVCEHCINDREQSCLQGATLTYSSPTQDEGGVTYGGYSTGIVVTEKFVIRIPPGSDLPGTAPLLCAGVTTFSPLRHWQVKRGQRVGVIGLGGLGHLAVKLAASRGADVTIFTTSPGKLDHAVEIGASEAVLWSNAEAMNRLKNKFDLIIAAVPQSFPVQQFMNLLNLDGTLVNVGALEELSGFDGMSNATWRRKLTGSMIGGIAETQEVIDYCSARSIVADIELIKPEQIDEAFQRVKNKDVHFRFVIDMTSI